MSKSGIFGEIQVPNGENRYKISGNAVSYLFQQALHVERRKYD